MISDSEAEALSFVVEEDVIINRAMRVVLLAYDPLVFNPELMELHSIGIEYIPVATPEEVVVLCASGTVDGVILGPAEMHTYRLLRTLKSDPHTNLPVLVLLGAEQLDLEERIILEGADDVVVAPWNPRAIRARVERLCRKHLSGLGIEDHYGVMKSLILTVEKHDSYTAQHVERLRFLSGHVALHMGLLAREVAAVRAAGLLHDIGKISVPGDILRKPSALSPEEWAIMRLHPQHGAEIAISLHQGPDIAPMVRSHHERWDGTGYPDGLSQNSIPLGGRIVAVVDAFDAMITNRPYRAALSMDEAKGRLERAAGSQFDANVVHSLLSLSPVLLNKQFPAAKA